MRRSVLYVHVEASGGMMTKKEAKKAYIAAMVAGIEAEPDESESIDFKTLLVACDEAHAIYVSFL